MGAALGGLFSGAGEAISQGISKAAAPNLSRADLESQVSKVLSASDDTGIKPTGDSKCGGR